MSVDLLDSTNYENEKEWPEITDENRIETLKDLIEFYLPKLKDKVTTAKLGEDDSFILTPDLFEDKFTPKHHFHAYTLLGMAVKYVQLHGLQVTIGGQ